MHCIPAYNRKVFKVQNLRKIMEINFNQLLGMTIGELAAMTQDFLNKNPQFKTAQQLLDDYAKETI